MRKPAHESRHEPGLAAGRRRPPSGARPGRRAGVAAGTVAVGALAAGALVALATPASAEVVAGPAGPAKPTLTPYYPTPGSALSSDGKVSLRIGSVVAQHGSIGSVTLRYGTHRQAVPVVPGRATYDIIVTGLQNGHRYTFTAQVCTTAHRCRVSGPTSFTPYGIPKPPTVTGTVADDEVTLAWGAVDTDASPMPLSCSITVSGDPEDDAAAEITPDPAQPGTATFTGSHGTTYTAAYLCSVADGRLFVRTTSEPIVVP
jgi:hypothetical protein